MITLSILIFNTIQADQLGNKPSQLFEGAAFALQLHESGRSYFSMETNKGVLKILPDFATSQSSITRKELKDAKLTFSRDFEIDASKFDVINQSKDFDVLLGYGNISRSSVVFDFQNGVISFPTSKQVRANRYYEVKIKNQWLKLPIGLDGTIWLSPTEKIEWNDPSKIPSTETFVVPDYYPVRERGGGFSCPNFKVSINGTVRLAYLNTAELFNWYRPGEAKGLGIETTTEEANGKKVEFGISEITAFGTTKRQLWQNVDDRMTGRLPKDFVLLGTIFMRNYRIRLSPDQHEMALQPFSTEALLKEDRNYTVVSWYNGTYQEQLYSDNVKRRDTENIIFPVFISRTKRKYHFADIVQNTNARLAFDD